MENLIRAAEIIVDRCPFCGTSNIIVLSADLLDVRCGFLWSSYKRVIRIKFICHGNCTPGGPPVFIREDEECRNEYDMPIETWNYNVEILNKQVESKQKRIQRNREAFGFD